MDAHNINHNRYLKALQNSSFFKDSSTESLLQLLEMLKPEQWKPKTFKNSIEVSSTFYFIVSGRLKIFKSNPDTGREHTVFVLSKGDVFDVLSLLDTKSHDVYWEALDTLKVLKISMEQMRYWILKYPKTHTSIFYYLGERMQQLMNVATDVTLHSTIVRLSSLLLKNINGETRKLELINNLPNEEIACLIGTTRAVVSRHIQELKDDKLPIFSTGMIGQYAHGNEPSHHVAYLYNSIEQPWKTQEMVRRIIKSQYSTKPDGYCGNEDCGQMSAWLVFSSIGLYPINPADGIYSITSPFVAQATIQLENGKQFKVTTENQSDENKYIQAITLNGKPYNKLTITHQQIVLGGVLHYVLGDSPNKEVIKNTQK